jgi:hypothetical protein
LRANLQLEHGRFCECTKCDKAAADMSTRYIRERVGCRLADASGGQAAQMMATFTNLIHPGHIDLMAEDCRYMAINAICAQYVPVRPY